MASKAWATWWLHLILVVAAVSTWWQLANSDPQTNGLGEGCSSVYANNTSDFFHNLNASFSNLRSQLSENRRFATANEGNTSEPVYALVQCRNYLSEGDCLACYDSAVTRIRTCSNATGARVTYDGCFLRYEAYNFYTKTNENALRCEGRAATPGFSTELQKLLSDLEVATPKTEAHFAATKREVPNGGNSTIYGVAQCTETVTQGGCVGCLNAAYEEMQGCLTNTEGRVTDAACFMRYSDRPFFADNQTVDLTTFLEEGGNSSNNKAIIGGVAGGAGLVIILVTIIIWYKFSRQLKAAMIGNLLGATKLQRPNTYSYEDLKEATNNFSEENKLGQGSFGVVYKATWKNDTIVAVKKLDMSYSRAKADFETEVRIISNVHHRNLVRLLGCCSKGSELLLVYECMENGSLDRFLYGDRLGTLTWKQRFDIIAGTAKGIAYLHENYHVTVIHRDIKPSNILLDKEFQAKIADFGLARLLSENQSHVSTKFAGTLGYTAPEYATYGHLSEKVDIYSFGIVILEIISGRRCGDMNIDSDTGYLLEQARKLYESDMHQNLADKALDSDEYNPEEFKKLVEIALACTQSTPSSRPSMSEILAMLLSDQSIKLRAPVSTGSSASNATVSISHYTGR